jgi:hypothetical protein
MANDEHVAILMKGVEAWNEWRQHQERPEPARGGPERGETERVVAAVVPICADPPRCSMGMVNLQADGLNVRATPNGPPVMSLVNGVPLIPLGREGDWLLVAAGCDLTPTFAWSWTAGVPLNRCWVYF